jgi:Uncharacterized alpha/beta hydrolase domain (DUF2235)
MYSHPDLEIQFVGVWDTVGALGIPVDGFRPPVLTKRWSFHDTDLSRSVRNAYHALAIDEQRGPFEPTLWKQHPQAPPAQTLEQVWFAGVHCDIGGGYAEPELSDISLLWMVEKARACGLAFEGGRLVPVENADAKLRAAAEQVAPDAHGELHESLKGFYRLLPRHRRGLAEKDGSDAEGGALATSAERRHREDHRYRPRGLAEWLAARKPTKQVQDRV